MCWGRVGELGPGQIERELAGNDASLIPEALRTTGFAHDGRLKFTYGSRSSDSGMLNVVLMLM